MNESDPTGKKAGDPGAKLDAGKNRLGLVLGGFARALQEVGKVGTYGAAKYSPNGWMEVPDGVARYTDAQLRHHLEFAAGRLTDGDTGLLHLAHEAWNALARLELVLRQREREVSAKPRMLVGAPDVPLTPYEEDAWDQMLRDSQVDGRFLVGPGSVVGTHIIGKTGLTFNAQNNGVVQPC
jgi:hypothetical protein